jgi:hypothetical protein
MVSFEFEETFVKDPLKVHGTGPAHGKDTLPPPVQELLDATVYPTESSAVPRPMSEMPPGLPSGAPMLVQLVIGTRFSTSNPAPRFNFTVM